MERINTQEIINKYHKISKREFKKGFIHISDICKCPFKHKYFDEEKKEYQESLKNILRIGTVIHDYVQEAFTNILDKEVICEYEIREKIDNFTLLGHIDLYFPEFNFILELKTTQKSISTVFPEPNHLLQVYLYAYFLKSNNIQITYINKNIFNSRDFYMNFEELKELVLTKVKNKEIVEDTETYIKKVYNYILNNYNTKYKEDLTFLLFNECSYCEFKEKCEYMYKSK